MTVVVPHVDDVAGSRGANAAMFELAASGAVTCGSVIVPGPWFPEVAAHPDVGSLDLGIHLTLTSESAAFRWRPLSTVDRASGLLDPAGYLWPTVPEVRAHASPDAVAAELRAQIDAALAAGIDVTHLDSHMGAALAPEFVDATVQIAREYRLPLLFPADLAGYFAVLKMGEVDRAGVERARDPEVAVGDAFVMPLIHQGEDDHAHGVAVHDGLQVERRLRRLPGAALLGSLRGSLGGLRRGLRQGQLPGARFGVAHRVLPAQRAVRRTAL